MNKRSLIILAALVAGSFAACGSEKSPPQIEVVHVPVAPTAFVESAMAQARVAELRARFGILPSRESSRVTFERVDETHARARVAPSESAAAMRTASVILPARANDAVTIEDDTTHLRARFVLQGATEARGVSANGLVLYPHAIAGADVIYRAHAGGTEDYVAFESRPAVEALTYDLDVSEAAGVRMIGRSLELLDRGGTPRLRIDSPYIVTADRTRVRATLSLTGCAYDANPAAPWGRAVTAPGASTCAVHLAWHANAYPIVVDPEWLTTGAMPDPRRYFSATLLPTGKVLYAGGFATGFANPYFNEADLYDPTTGTFAFSGNMLADREGHAGVLLSTGKVLVVGGDNSGAGYLASAELYDPTLGTWSATGSAANARDAPIATLLPTGKVLIGPSPAELYDPTAGTFAPTGTMVDNVGFYTATLLKTGKVLLAGGNATAELYDPSVGTFTATGSMAAARAQHTATLLPSGNVLMAGGSYGVGTAELYDPVSGTFSATGSLVVGRYLHTATFLPAIGQVLIAGGSGVGGTLSEAELYDPVSGRFTATVSLLAPHQEHSATLLTNGNVIIAPSPELFIAVANATACTTGSICGSGICVKGICCDALCDGQCEACDLPGHVGTCTGVVGPPPAGKAGCAGTVPCGGACDGTTRSACVFPTTACGSSCLDAKETTSLCDGAGSCQAQPGHACNNFICADATSCKTKCASNGDCISGFTCANDGSCVTGAVCADDHTSKGSDGTPKDCAPYLCSASGSCSNACMSVAECLSPNVCNPTGQCIAAASSDPGAAASNSGGCSASGRSSPNAAWALLSLCALAARTRRAGKAGRSRQLVPRV